jgi:ubiquinone/menaquinone biosynthesis C-methylase UbiE
MNHDDHIRLIADGIGRGAGGVWTDLGAGAGAFTLALRDVAGPGVEIVAVDRDRASLGALRTAMDRHFPGTRLQLLEADFARPLQLPPLDGLLAANAIHYVHDQVALLERWRGYLKADGRLVIVEYDTDEGNRWVPYPISFAAFGPLALAAGFAEPVLLTTQPSRFLGRFYAAVTYPENDRQLARQGEPTLRSTGGRDTMSPRASRQSASRARSIRQ